MSVFSKSVASAAVASEVEASAAAASEVEASAGAASVAAVFGAEADGSVSSIASMTVAVTPQVLLWPWHLYALMTVITCGRKLEEKSIKTLETMFYPRM
jgi:hypothetical protein